MSKNIPMSSLRDRCARSTSVGRMRSNASARSNYHGRHHGCECFAVPAPARPADSMHYFSAGGSCCGMDFPNLSIDVIDFGDA